MFKKLPLFVALLAVFSAKTTEALSQCSCSASYTLTGGNTNLTITNGQTYCLVSGTQTGNIEIQSGGKICVSSGATLSASMNNFAGTVENRGTFQPANGLTCNGGAKVDNYGTCTLGSFNLNGAVTMINEPGASFSLSSTLAISGGSSFSNAGTFSCAGLNFNGQATFTNSGAGIVSLSGGFMLASSSTFTNDGRFFMSGSSGDFNSNSGCYFNNNGEFRVYSGGLNLGCNLTNAGMLYCANNININSGSSVTNNCRFVAVKGFINNATFTNSGLVWSTGNTIDARIMNNAGATFTNTPTAQLRGYDFGNDGTVTGSGAYYFTNATKNQGTVNGSAANPIQFYDASQTGNQIFDIQNGTMSNISRPASMTPGDTTSWGTCSNDNYQTVYNTHTFLAKSSQPLPLNLTGFSGKTDDRGSVWLSWNTVSEHRMSRFEVERSGNGKSFDRIATVAAKGNNSAEAQHYSLLDDEAATAVRYYRLKMVNEDGTFAYSSLLQFRTEGAAAGISLVPNPVQSAAVLSIRNASAGTATISLFDAMGRTALRTDVVLGEGSVSLPLSGVETLAPGTYLLRVSQNGQTLGQPLRMQKR